MLIIEHDKTLIILQYHTEKNSGLSYIHIMKTIFHYNVWSTFLAVRRYHYTGFPSNNLRLKESKHKKNRNYQRYQINKWQDIFHTLTQIALMSDCANGMDCSSSSS